MFSSRCLLLLQLRVSTRRQNWRKPTLLTGFPADRNLQGSFIFVCCGYLIYFCGLFRLSQTSPPGHRDPQKLIEDAEDDCVCSAVLLVFLAVVEHHCKHVDVAYLQDLQGLLSDWELEEALNMTTHPIVSQGNLLFTHHLLLFVKFVSLLGIDPIVAAQAPAPTLPEREAFLHQTGLHAMQVHAMGMEFLRRYELAQYELRSCLFTSCYASLGIVLYQIDLFHSQQQLALSSVIVQA